jgi:glycosyltransferase involved in cell wall biosynthesis
MTDGLSALNQVAHETHAAHSSAAAPRGGLDDVTVLIPVYNCQPDLERTLASLVAGLAADATLKVLLVDDGSMPAIVAPTLPQLNLEIIRLTPNGGIERALRAGCQHLIDRGVRFIARIDAGDLAVAGRFTQQREYLQSHPQIGAVGTWADVVSMTGQYLFSLKPPTVSGTIRRRRFFRSCFVHPAMMLRAEAVAQAGNYRERYRAAEDLDLFLRIMEHWDCANLAQIGLLYELNENGISATRRRTQIISTLRLQLRYFEPLNPFYWLGLSKNCLHLILPYRALQRVKLAVLHR